MAYSDASLNVISVPPASTNALSATLDLSEKTVDRHVSTIFTKIDVNSRTAATACAYEHDPI
jgi:DNA-binding NarL/FixJ family response regulator